MTEKEFRRLPKGLREFRASLSDLDYAPELLNRLLKLPENGLRPMVDAHAKASVLVRSIEDALSIAKRNATRLAEEVFDAAMKNWLVAEIQAATGYDHD